MKTKKLVSLSLVICLFSMPTFSNENIFKITDDKYTSTQKGAEYISGTTYNNDLMKINLIGEINKPGVHLIPVGTKFTTLLSYAGGPTKDANISKIEIKRETPAGYKNIELDFKSFMETNEKDLTLSPNDTIYVNKENEFISSRKLTVIATVLGILVSSIIIKDKL